MTANKQLLATTYILLKLLISSRVPKESILKNRNMLCLKFIIPDIRFFFLFFHKTVIYDEKNITWYTLNYEKVLTYSNPSNI